MSVTPDFASRAELLKALADETRLRILSVLMERGETCVCEFLELFGGTASNLSFHLNKLKAVGLVSSRKAGKWIFYRPRREGLARVCKWLCPLVDPDRVPERSTKDSLAALCERETPPLSLGQVRMRRRKGDVVVTSCCRPAEKKG